MQKAQCDYVMAGVVKWDVYGNTNKYISEETLVAVAQSSTTDVECPAKCKSVNTVMTSPSVL